MSWMDYSMASPLFHRKFHVVIFLPCHRSLSNFSHYLDPNREILGVLMHSQLLKGLKCEPK
jgi:hypothetical protein